MSKFGREAITLKGNLINSKTSFFCLFFVIYLGSGGETICQQQRKSPGHFKLQYAGDIGFFAIGFGKSILKEKVEVDFFLGYLPESVGGDRIFTSAVNASYFPVRELEFKYFTWTPLSTGVQLAYTFGDEYFAFDSRKYPTGYYGFSTALHLYYYLGGRINPSFIKSKSKIGIYYELGSNIEYSISYIQNPQYLSLGKIFNLAIGIKLTL